MFLSYIDIRCKRRKIFLEFTTQRLLFINIYIFLSKKQIHLSYSICRNEFDMVENNHLKNFLYKHKNQMVDIVKNRIKVLYGL